MYLEATRVCVEQGENIVKLIIMQEEQGKVKHKITKTLTYSMNKL